jgi:hypothetical protein
MPNEYSDDYWINKVSEMDIFAYISLNEIMIRDGKTLNDMPQELQNLYKRVDTVINMVSA